MEENNGKEAPRVPAMVYEEANCQVSQPSYVAKSLQV